MSRVTRLDGHIDEKKVSLCTRQLLEFDEADPTSPIRLVINSEGANIDVTQLIINTLKKRIRAPVVTVGVDNICSGALAVFVHGARRIAFKRSEFLFHEVYYDEFPSGIDRLHAHAARELAKALDKDDRQYFNNCTFVGEHHVSLCQLSAEQLRARVTKGINREYIINASEARRLGFVDHVVKNMGGVQRVERQLRKEWQGT